jgi:hypothetical protein
MKRFENVEDKLLLFRFFRFAHKWLWWTGGCGSSTFVLSVLYNFTTLFKIISIFQVFDRFLLNFHLVVSRLMFFFID